jgi:hypothetical protein
MSGSIGTVHMKSHDHFVTEGGRRYAGRPMTRRFTILSFIGLGFLIVGLAALYNAGWPPALFSGPFWLCILLIAAELVFIV